MFQSSNMPICPSMHEAIPAARRLSFLFSSIGIAHPMINTDESTAMGVMRPQIEGIYGPDRSHLVLEQSGKI